MHSSVQWDVSVQLAYIKSINMLNRYTQGAKKRGQVGSTSTGKTCYLYVSNRLIVLTLWPINERIITKFVSNQ